MRSIEPRKLTWASLLAYWMEFAQAAVALPDDAQGRAWKAAVPPVIGLQAVYMALKEIEELPGDQRALGIDRAQVLVDRHTGELRQAFAGQPMPPLLQELMQDAADTLAEAQRLYTPPQYPESDEEASPT